MANKNSGADGAVQLRKFQGSDDQNFGQLCRHASNSRQPARKFPCAVFDMRSTIVGQIDGSNDALPPVAISPPSPDLGSPREDYIFLRIPSPDRVEASSPGNIRSTMSAKLRRHKSDKSTHVRFQDTHPFVPGKIRHKQPGEVSRRNFTQYVYSHTNTDFRITHHFLCEKDDLEKPVYYYHDVGGYTRLDENHRLTLHLGNHSGTPVLGAMWHGSSGMYFAVGPYLYDESVKTIQRQYCEYLKPISSAPTRWHMDFVFGGGAGEGPRKTYRWQVVHLVEAIPHFRHGKLELREKDGFEVDEQGKKIEKTKLLAACRNIDDLSTNLWVRNAGEEMGNELARIKWKTWVLLTWGGMRDRMAGPHNTGSPHHTVGFTKSTKTVKTPGGIIPSSGHTIGGCFSPPRSKEIKEIMLNAEEY
ncbi:hypothetical protein BUE80_DR005954 [Diplocarpon rosae]|nr:hypothetical protein BUE80_DR005954 [Diplocarpon rosae]